MQTYGGMKFKTLFKRILGRFVESMRRMKGYTDTRFLRWEKIMPLFKYEPLILFPKPKTLDEEENKWGRTIMYKSSKTTKRL
jgi:hypothetical protein